MIRTIKDIKLIRFSKIQYNRRINKVNLIFPKKLKRSKQF